jgi:hypothetical protein
MAADVKVPGGAVAVAAAPSVGDVLRFAAYAADLVGEGRVTGASWHSDDEPLFVDVADAADGEVLAHLLGLDARSDLWCGDPERSFSCWKGTSGGVSVFMRAPLALGALPAEQYQDEQVQRLKGVA